MKINIAITAAAITPAESHPRTRSGMGVTSVPMTLVFDAISIISTMIGTEVTPLMTALQNNALIGSIDVKSSARPTTSREHDDSVKAFRQLRFEREAVLPPECACHCVGSRAGQHGQREQACADDAEAEEQERKVARDRFERGGGLR